MNEHSFILGPSAPDFKLFLAKMRHFLFCGYAAVRHYGYAVPPPTQFALGSHGLAQMTAQRVRIGAEALRTDSGLSEPSSTTRPDASFPRREAGLKRAKPNGRIAAGPHSRTAAQPYRRIALRLPKPKSSPWWESSLWSTICRSLLPSSPVSSAAIASATAGPAATATVSGWGRGPLWNLLAPFPGFVLEDCPA